MTANYTCLSFVAVLLFFFSPSTTEALCSCQKRGRRVMYPTTCSPLSQTQSREDSECDGVSLLHENSIDTHVATFEDNLFGDSSGATIQDGGYIDLIDEGCLQLNKNMTTFSLSFWVNASYVPNTGLIFISTKSPYGGSQNGFSLTGSFIEGNTKLQLILKSSDGSGNGDRRGSSVGTFNVNSWAFVTLVWEPKGAVSDVTVSVNLIENKMSLYSDIYNSDWRIGDVGWGRISPFQVSEFKSYQRPLTVQEQTEMYLKNAADAGLAPNLASSLDVMEAYFEGAHSNKTLFAETAEKFAQDATFIVTDNNAIARALDLVDLFEASNEGPLFMTSTTRNGISRTTSDGLLRGMILVQQAIMDNVYRSTYVQQCADLLEGRIWKTSSHFPGDVNFPSGRKRRTNTFNVQVHASVPAMWGLPVAFATEPMRRPTGVYLPPGVIATVQVPDAVVTTGNFHVLVGAHTSDNSNKRTHRRLDRVFSRYVIASTITRIASPLGGGIYIEVPYLADLDIISIEISGQVVKSPFFSYKKSYNTTLMEWDALRTSSPAPWCDFETDTFLLQVPTPWIKHFENPIPILQDWDKSMNGVSDYLAYPHERRNKHVLYIQPDLQIKHGVYGIGYPQVNNVYSSSVQEKANVDSVWYLSDVTKSEVEYHELGHAQLMSKFRGETEADVNFLHCYVRNVQFGVDLDTAFKQSFGPSYGDVGFAPDDAAIHWMITENFRNGREMDYTNSEKNEFRYQHRGYAKYVDIARLYGWETLRTFHREENYAYMAGNTTDRGYRLDKGGLTDPEDRIYRLSVAAGSDMTPLIHFWGIHPSASGILANETAKAGLGPHIALRDFLLRYRSIIPANNVEFNEHFERVYPGRPSGGNPNYGHGWYNEWRDVWNETHAAQARQALDDIINIYFSTV